MTSNMLKPVAVEIENDDGDRLIVVMMPSGDVKFTVQTSKHGTDEFANGKKFSFTADREFSVELAGSIISWANDPVKG